MDHEAVEATLAAMKENARLHHVPIMEDEGMAQLLELLVRQEPGRILEIGSAIGYSALRMAQALPGASVDTVERDDARAADAIRFIEEAGMSSRVRIFHADALELDVQLLRPAYDAIFIDAAKGQYERFFEKFEPLLSAGGSIYCDNMHMHGMADVPLSEVPRRNRTMIRNLKNFREHMRVHPAYETAFFDKGDGLMVCTKK